jgi:hypothetical protein
MTHHSTRPFAQAGMQPDVRAILANNRPGRGDLKSCENAPLASLDRGYRLRTDAAEALDHKYAGKMTANSRELKSLRAAALCEYPCGHFTHLESLAGESVS